MACVGRAQFRSFVAAKGSQRACITIGQRTSWKPGKKRLAGDTTRQATSSEVTGLKREARDLKEVVAEQTLELRLLKKSMLGDGGDPE